MKCDFVTAGRIIFGRGRIAEFAEITSDWGNKALLVRGRTKEYGQEFYRILEKTGIQIAELPVSHEPDIKTINEASKFAKAEKCEFVIGFGGGSVIDTGKSTAALINNDGDLMDYLEVVGNGRPLKNPSVKYIAIPTTAGTGSEVTKNAVVGVPEKKVKVSMRSPLMLPTIALVDPELTRHLPPAITASTGMDAFIQVIEPYVCNSPNALVDSLCRDAIPRAASHLERVYHNGDDLDARENMAWVSLMGGLSLANARLGAVHGFAGPIGGMYNASHGAVCAALLPAVMQVNSEKLETLPGSQTYQKRFKEVAEWVTQKQGAEIREGMEWFAALAKKLSLPTLREFGIQKADFSGIVEKAAQSSSMKGNPVKLEKADMQRILEIAF